MSSANVVVVDFTAEPGIQPSAEISRGLSATGPWTVIANIPLLAEIGYYSDNTAPLDTPVWYRAMSPGGVTEVYGPFTLVSGGNVFLRDPLRPWADVEFEFCATQAGLKKEMCLPTGPEFVWVGLGEQTYRMDAGLFDRLDAERPADVFARRKDLDGSMRFMTKTLAAKDAIRSLFTAGGPLLLQLPTVYGWRDAYLQPFDLVESYLYPDQRMPHRLWDVAFRTVDAPTGPIQGTECANWCFVDETWGTFADMTGSGGTWGSIAAGTTQCPGGEPVEALHDTFTRTVSDAWGTADTGQTWTIAQGTATQFDVTGTTAIQTHTAANQTLVATVPYSSPDINMLVDFSVSQVAAGDSHFIFANGRQVDTSNFYSARILIAAGGNMSITVRKRVAGVDTMLASLNLGIVYVASKMYRIRFAIQGNQLSAKMWDPLLAEPAAYQVTAADSDFTAAGQIGIRTFTGAASTNTFPLVYRFDDLTVTP